jgi:hypothetical protein
MFLIYKERERERERGFCERGREGKWEEKI